jgi:hypothetical protein
MMMKVKMLLKTGRLQICLINKFRLVLGCFYGVLTIQVLGLGFYFDLKAKKDQAYGVTVTKWDFEMEYGGRRIFRIFPWAPM